jgi:hypothetical protein
VKRIAIVSAVVLLLTACATTTERPEGIVERWLSALNQGSAGEPLRYAYLSVSGSVLPGWRTADPGAFDVIEVGRARSCTYVGPAACEARVPFRVVLTDGEQMRFDALVGIDRAADEPTPSRVIGVVAAGPQPRLPSEGGPPIGSASTSGWLLAIGTGLGLLLLAEGAMRFVRREPLVRRHLAPGRK